MRDLNNRVPINAIARRVTTSAKEQDSLNFAARNAIMSKIPLPMKEYKYTNYNGKPINPAFDLRGVKVGKVEVIGLALLHLPAGQNAQRKGHKKGRPWVLKCKCGYYFIKRHKPLVSMIKLNSSDTCCYECEKIQRLK